MKKLRLTGCRMEDARPCVPQSPPSQCQPRYAYLTFHQNQKCNLRNPVWTPVVRITGFEQLDQIHLAEVTSQWLALLNTIVR